MSPSNINSFVGDLVQMATAFENLPKVEKELSNARAANDILADRINSINADLEQSRNYATSLEQKVRSLEVERDDASFRVLEAEDKALHVLAMAKAARVSLEQMTSLLDPPKPEPEPVAPSEPQAPTTPAPEAPSIPGAVHSISETGQSESSPTATTSQDEKSGSVDNTATHAADASSSTPEPSGPYYGKRYIDFPGWVSYGDWIDGGGTHDNYWAGRS